jgi:hypothetical protein
MLGTIIGSGINLVANGIGSWLANKRAKEAQRIQDEEYKRQREDLTSELNSNYLDRADSQNVIRKVTDANEEAMRQLNTQAIRGGATDEAKVAMASKMNKNIAGVVGNLAAMGEQRKDVLRQERRQLDANHAGIKSSRLADQSGINTLLTNIGSAAQAIGGAWSKGDTPKVDAGVSNNNSTTNTTTTEPTEPVMMTKNGQHVGAPQNNQTPYGQGPINGVDEEQGYRTKNGWV